MFVQMEIFTCMPWSYRATELQSHGATCVQCNFVSETYTKLVLFAIVKLFNTYSLMCYIDVQPFANCTTSYSLNVLYLTTYELTLYSALSYSIFSHFHFPVYFLSPIKQILINCKYVQ